MSTTHLSGPLVVANTGSSLAGTTTLATATITTGNITTANVTTLNVSGVATPTGGVAPAGGATASARMINVGEVPAITTTQGTDTTPVSTQTYIGEVFVPSNCTVTGIAVLNGSVASGNVKVGLANSAGTVVASSASTAMSGTNAYQLVPLSATYGAVGPATYYVLFQVDNTTARFRTHILGTFGSAVQTGQTYGTFTTITPPTTFTATATSNIAALY